MKSLDQSTFTGGAITVVQDTTSKIVNDIRMIIANTIFEDCEGFKGGALAIYNVPNFYIEQATTFMRNVAKDSGGALYFECPNYGNDLSQCSLSIK